jgi:peptidoglycan/LPS O-acetylase OafA/YrhL
MRQFFESPRIADVARGRNNNFNLLRFVAAFLVILHHAKPGDILLTWWLTNGQEDAGSVAVLIFFAISGFLVTQSFTRSSLTGFLTARALRIFPALWVAVPFTIIVSSFASAVPWGRYLTHPQTIRYWLHNSFMWDMQYTLPGAFLHVPMARSVNGSLWTLPAELRMYWVCAGLGLLGLYASRAAFNALFVALMVAGTIVRPETLPLTGTINVAQWEFAFLIGAAFLVNRDYIRLNIPVAILLLLVSKYTIEDPYMGHLYLVPAFAYATLVFGLHPALFFRPFTRLGDYSYGLYIYAFPLQQEMMFYHPKMNWLPRLALTFPIILGVAVLSWHVIEEPALRLKKRFQPKPAPLPAESLVAARG